jgi:hypothetical protein
MGFQVQGILRQKRVKRRKGKRLVDYQFSKKEISLCIFVFNMEYDFKILNFDGWHGTSEKNGNSILASNFMPSEGSHHWLGEGVYFFTQGIGNPLEHAKNWVESEAHKTGFKAFSIIKARTLIKEEALLDLRQEAGIELFLEHKRFVLARMRQKGKTFKSKDDNYTDGKVFDNIKNKANIEVIISPMHIRFGQDRIEKIHSMIPNCMLLCTSHPEDNIEKESLELVKSWNI